MKVELRQLHDTPASDVGIFCAASYDNKGIG